MPKISDFFRRSFVLRAMAAVMAISAVSAVTLPGTAHAWDRFGGRGYYGHGYGYRGYGPGIGLGALALSLGVGALLAAPPPVYYAPPVVYGAPTVYAAPPVYAAPAAAQTCYAGPYVCPLDQATPVGGHCSCPTNTEVRSYGSAR